MPEFTSPQGRRIAYDHTPGEGPGVVFLGGFRPDRETGPISAPAEPLEPAESTPARKDDTTS